jgi:aminomethyltransferase
MSQQPRTFTQTLPTPFHARIAPLMKGHDWSRWSGFATVNTFTNVEEEYFAMRNAATLFDVSPMTKYRIAGPDAGRYLNRLLPRDIDKLAPGRVFYTVWCNDAGHVIDDGTLFRFGPDEFRLNAQERHLPWLEDSAIGFDVIIEDVTEAIAGLSLQGPTSCAILRELQLSGVGDLKPFDMADFDLGDIKLTVTRTGFSGDLGFELWVDADHAESLWDRLMAAGAELHGLKPSGSAALDMVRIEAGFIATNTDFVAADQALRDSRGRSPFELGLGWMVNFNKGHFNGRRALLREHETGSSRYCLVGLDVAGNKPAHQALIYYGGGARDVGAVTSAMWSPTCKRNIALAMVETPFHTKSEGLWADVYVQKELKWEKVRAACQIVERPFFKPARRTNTPPADR